MLYLDSGAKGGANAQENEEEIYLSKLHFPAGFAVHQEEVGCLDVATLGFDVKLDVLQHGQQGTKCKYFRGNII